MNEKNQKQSWWNCYHAVGDIGGTGFPSGMIKEDKLYDNCSCINKKILELKTYPTDDVAMIVGCGLRMDLVEVSVLACITNRNYRLINSLDDEEKRGLKLEIDRKTMACTHCGYYERKEINP